MDKIKTIIRLIGKAVGIVRDEYRILYGSRKSVVRWAKTRWPEMMEGLEPRGLIQEKPMDMKSLDRHMKQEWHIEWDEHGYPYEMKWARPE
jgi:hypothetical protein